MGILTFCGAFLTILALAVDPFAQQILSFPVKPIQASNETASIPCVQNYTSGLGGDYNGLHGEAGLTPSLARAIISGILISNSSIRPECSSGSCSYPEFVSLGNCGHYKDVTEQMTEDCQEDAPDCNYTSPSGFKITINLENLTIAQDIGQNMSILYVDYWLSKSSTTERTLGIWYPIVSFITAIQNETIVYTPTTTPPKPTFTECVMYWCQKKYATSNYSGSAPELQFSKPSNCVGTRMASWHPCPE
ncbi:hypothetical protein N7493_011582 [Penicillium malachiteum]|uniref:Uncharacterized protein n=1 Tax=Penicillium malachiteum TaxID=1324776 RepID=A0AAD6MQQ4_9EURO|nr:hypothetical protein N7493_011582 [Penicillium malachiteum]